MVLSKRLKVVGFIIAASGLLLVALDWLYPLKLPGQDSQRFARIVVDQDGKPLRAFADKNGVWRYQVTIDEVSPLYIEALLNYEDRYFWSHPGVNPFAIARAAYQNIASGKIVSGGSTITMQVARLLHPHRRTLAGKLQQVFRTFQLEWHLSKTDILQLYLNIAPFGGTIEGVQAASFTYLEKSAKSLSRAEAALLAVLPQAPTRYRPDRNAIAAQAARDKVLDRLATLDVWSKAQVEDAKLETVFAYKATHQTIAPLLSLRLLKQNPTMSVIHSSIDGDLQRSLEAYLKGYVEQLPKNTSAAVLVVDNHSAQVKAYLGSADFTDQNRFGHVDMVKATRSVGSTLKPFLFAMALEDGLIHSHSLLMDVPRTTGKYRPANFSQGFSGPVSAAQSLQRSLNVPFVDLLERFGPATFVDKLNNAGVKLTMVGGKANLAVILGGVGSSLENLVTGYSALARSGVAMPLTYSNKSQTDEVVQRRLLSPQSAWITQKVLSQIDRPNAINTYARNLELSLAWKTGTSYGYRDTWAIGVSNQYTIGVWVGRPDGTPLPGYSGRQTAGPLLFAVSDHLHDAIEPIQMPDNISEQTICWPLGLSPDVLEHCHQKHQAWLIDDAVVPTWFGEHVWQANPMPYWVNNDTGKRVNVKCSAVNRQQQWIALWPRSLEPWLPSKYKLAGQLPLMDKSCDKAVVGNDGSLKIVGIENNSIYTTGGNTDALPTVVLKAQGGSGKQHWYINGQLVHSDIGSTGVNHAFKTNGSKQILVLDDAGNIDKTRVTIKH